jgi:predicted nucleic acid-binding protein
MEARSRLQWEWVDPGRAEYASAWFFRWGDTEPPFSDGASFTTMKEVRIIKLALSLNRHFSQAGFELPPGGFRRRLATIRDLIII